MIRPVVPALVGSFFALSGFLVAGSALRTRDTGKFLLNRALRIFPALSVETLLSALILGPVFTSLTLWQYFTHPEFYRYFGNMIGWVYFFLPGVFDNNPLPRVINGQLWTLPPEFWCYFLMAFALTTSLILQRGVLLALAAVSMAGILVLYVYDPVTFAPNGENFYRPWYIIVLFWLGVITFLYADRIPMNLPLFALSALLYWSTIFFNVLPPLSGIPLTYCMAYIGMCSFKPWDRIVKSDYSYGIYLYHFPIIQALIAVNSDWLLKLSHPVQLLIVFPVALLVSALVASASWRFVERPALALRKTYARTRTVHLDAEVQKKA